MGFAEFGSGITGALQGGVTGGLQAGVSGAVAGGISSMFALVLLLRLSLMLARLLLTWILCTLVRLHGSV